MLGGIMPNNSNNTSITQDDTANQTASLGNGNSDKITQGKGNNDTAIIGNGNNDIIIQGDGNNDIATVGNGNNDLIVQGDGNNDKAVVGNGNDIITQGNGNNDTITAGNGNDIITVGNGLNDIINTGNGNDTFTLGSGSATVQTGNGNNTFIMGGGIDNIQAGHGYNIVIYHGPIYQYNFNVDVSHNALVSDSNPTRDGSDTLAGISQLKFSNGAYNLIVGTVGSNIITGTAGDDVIIGGPGNDSIKGIMGNDFIDGGAGTNTAVYVGASSQYTFSLLVSGNPSSPFDIVVSDSVAGRDGVDTLANMQFAQFSNTTISVASIEGIPVANPDSNAIDEDHTVSGNVLTNDTVGIVGDVNHVSLVNGSAANVGAQITLASGALLTVNADGIYSYDPTHSALYETLQIGHTALDSFTYQITDLLGHTSSTTANITVSVIDTGPTDSTPNSYAIGSEHVLGGSGLLSAIVSAEAGDSGDSVTVVPANIVSSDGALVKINADGSFVYDPTTATTIQNLAWNATTVDTFQYTAIDNHGASIVQTADVTVTGHNFNLITPAITSVNNGGYTLSLLNSVNQIYGDFESINLNLAAANGVSNNTFNFGGNNIMPSDSNNATIYGDGNSVNLSYGPTGSSQTGASLSNFNLVGGGNIIHESGNSNTLYGSSGAVSLSLTGTNNNAASFSGSSFVNVFYQAGGNSLISSGNNDLLYGAVLDFSITLLGGSNNSGYRSGVADLDQYIIKLGGNSLTDLTGDNNVVYGAMRNLSLSFTGGNANTSSTSTPLPSIIGSAVTDIFDTSSSSLFSSITLGTNTISVGDGSNDTIYGAMANFSLTFNPSFNNTGFIGNGISETNVSFRNDLISIGSNNIMLGNGTNDIIYGALQNFTLLDIGGSNNGGLQFASENGDENMFYNFGNNAITVGNGDHDITYGALQNFVMTLISGNFNTGNTAGQAYVQPDSFTMGANIIHMGDGAGDIIFGVMQNLSISVIGGNNNTIAHAGQSIIAGGTVFSAGNNNITIGDGNNDVVYGDIQNISISLQGGLSNTGGTGSGGATFAKTSFILGGDNISVGNGGNDVVFASMDSFNISVVQGGNSGSGIAVFANVSGAGNDKISFANSTVTIGNGSNDTVVADDVLNLTGLNLFLHDPNVKSAPNSVTWGNNTINGGTGNDNYIFSLVDSPSNQMAWQGVDILSNFAPSKGDMLSIGYATGAANASSLDASSAFVNINDGLIGSIGVAAIFNQLGNIAAASYQAAINTFAAADSHYNVNTSSAELSLLQDIAGYISSATGLTKAAGVTSAPQGGLILEGHSLTDMGSFTQINALNDLTVSAQAIAIISTNENTPIVISPISIRADLSPGTSGDTISSIQLLSSTSANGASLSIDGIGNITYNPMGAFTNTLVGAYADSFNVQVKDNYGVITTQKAYVTVKVVDTAPTDNSPNNYVIGSEHVLGANNLLSAVTPAIGDTLTVVPANVVSTDGALVKLNADGSFTYDPTTAVSLQNLAFGATASDSFSYTAIDNHGLSVSQVANITVTGHNFSETLDNTLGSSALTYNSQTIANGGYSISLVNSVNQLFGDFEHFNINLIAGGVSAASVTMLSDIFTLGANNITIEGVAGTTVFGDGISMNISVDGGSGANAAAAELLKSKFAFGGNTILNGNGINDNDVIYGSMQSFNLDVTAGNGNLGNNTNANIAVVSGDNFTFGGNHIGSVLAQISGNSVTAYGAMQTFTINLLSGSNNIGGANNGSASINNFSGNGINTFSLGGNAIHLGNGNNDIAYGAAQNVMIIAMSGSGNSAVFNNILNSSAGDGRALLTGDTLSFSANIVSLEDGNNDIAYGAMQSFILNGTGGNGVGDGAGVNNNNINPNSTFNFGSNNLTVGNGINDQIYGAMQSYLVTNIASSNIPAPTPPITALTGGNFSEVFNPGATSAGGNTLTVGSGAGDAVFGSIQIFEINLQGGSNDAPWGVGQAGWSSSGPVTLGGNTIIVGDGNNDLIYGAVQNFIANLSSGNFDTFATSPIVPPASNSEGYSFIQSVTMSLGSNNITIGNGADVNVYGAAENFDLNLAAGMNNVGPLVGTVNVRGSTFLLGSNIITVGSGDSATIYGDMQTFSLTVVGGSSSDNGTTGIGNQFQYYGTSLAGVYGLEPTGSVTNYPTTNFTMGGDTIHVGDGNNDTIYGVAQNFSISLTGGNNDLNGAGLALFSGDTIKFNSDNITVGNGNGDIVYAALDNMSLSAVNGAGNDAISGLASFTDNGQDYLGLQNNNSVAFGGGVTYTGIFGGNIITFSNTSVTVGNGINDTIVADDILNPTGLNTYLASNAAVQYQNIINWSNNVVNGGTGNDNYVFTMLDNINNNGPSANMAMQGVDIISNVNAFNPSKGDKLSFGNVTGTADAAALDANSAFVDIHEGGTLGGAIDGLAAIFNNSVGASAASALETAINSFISTNHPADTGLALMKDVASYIADTTAAGLAAAVGVADVQGGVILQGHTTAEMGSFSQIDAQHGLTVSATAIAVPVHH
jgi:hypothetical protein